MKTITTLQSTGTLTARQPLAVSPPGAAWGSDTAQSPKRLASMGYGQSATRYIPASTMRHVIRYGIASVVQAALVAQGRRLTLEELLALDKGFASQKKNAKNGKGKKKTTEAAPQNTQESAPESPPESAPPSGGDPKKKAHELLQHEIDVRRRNPLLSLLGMWGVPSELRVLNVIPRLGSAGGEVYGKASGLTRKALETGLVESLSGEDLRLYLSKLDDWSDANKDSTGLKHFSDATWEEITQGTACDWGYMIHRVDAIKSGAVLAALRAFAGDPVIGAHQAVGRGEVSIDLHSSLIHQDILRGPSATEVGSVHVARGVFEVTGTLAEDLKQFDESAQAGFPDMDFSIIFDASSAD